MSTDHHKQAQTGNGRPRHEDVAFEAKDVRVNPILKFLAYLGVTLVISYFIVLGVYRGLTTYWKGAYSAPVPLREEQGATLPPEPRLQGVPGHLSDPQSDLREMREADAKANDTLGWVDEKAGVAQIPVKEAMKLIAERGLPTISAPPAEKK